eukprot:CAMPEP_0201952752 /NCGR_PEP_ID=MMETSP0904-20121228/1395_1 /ASSEMBLY_ACC=CAM_ASM_000553 /TAXON_ID=420261 /ORGANISM="Thalassiosira antarctica, Strain CCMP982" /LENGTH=219 /DNA_ID=CAMNT_0048496517 /DNA_START=188 /DNA_END=845 /DNA_ORIENTATION=+
MMAHQYQGPATMKYIPVHLTAFTTVKQSRKRLRFQPTVKVQPIDCRMTKEEKSRSYYSKNELEAFSLEVKAIHALSKNLPDASSACGAHATSRDCMIGLEADPALRGLERYLCPTRVRNKVLAQKALFKYHKQLNANPNQTSEEKLQSLAAASAKLSQWSTMVAMETARLDSLRAYEGDYLISINDPVDISPFPATTNEEELPPMKIANQRGEDHIEHN